ncbi:hybrid sensor histidine kinase/response regulator [Piscinibacter terrae]|uniref:histidine kinase n=1 Tax=Piscinibacter terrae TaxID=2496871 RepID=A0A3N7HNW3_9BURK|nr:ATP-binding protein [Albitalea terrae]RQP22796.1 response regulator [Albitalea terrae]
MKSPTNDTDTAPRRKPAGKPRAARARPVRDAQELLAMERQARQDAEAATQAKDEFLSVVTHELRSPLNAIRGWSHVLRHSGELQPLQRRALDAIDRNTQAQVQLVDDLLDSQRILCGKLELVYASVPLRRLLEDALETVQLAAEAKRIRLETSHDRQAGMVRVDGERLRQALVKLLSNAVKFTPEDGIVTLCSSVRADGLAIEVSDTGAGLDASQLAALFERFSQADSSDKRRTNGLGLGLSLARQLAELHGGTIRAFSEGVGRGSRFTIELPASVLNTDLPTMPAGHTGSPLAGKRVVIVEDDDDGREVLGLILREAQVDLHSFDRAAKAYEYIAHLADSEQPDVLISDIAMPDEDGYEFIRRLRRLEGLEHRPHLVALALTSFSRREDRAKALQAGFDEHVPKPIDPERVLRTVAHALGVDDAPAVADVPQA